MEKLEEFGLIRNFDEDTVLDLLSGSWQKEVYSGSYDFGYKFWFNVLCSINATGYMSMYPMSFLNAVWLLSHIVWDYGFLLPDWLENLFTEILEVIVPPVISLFDFYSDLPKKSPLFRGYLGGSNMTIKTNGIFGVKERRGGMTYRMRGFTGIWLTNTKTNYSLIRGFALSIVYAW